MVPGRTRAFPRHRDFGRRNKVMAMLPTSPRAAIPASAVNPGACVGGAPAGTGLEDGVAEKATVVVFCVPATAGETMTMLPGTTVPVVSISSTVRILTVTCDEAGTVPLIVIWRTTSLVVGYDRRYPLTNAAVPDADCCAAEMPSTMT